MDLLLSAIYIGLHGLAIVILTGKYILSALVILPVLKRQGSEPEQARLHAVLAAASRPWILGSPAVFLVTGTVMMLTDSQDLGFLDFGNAWSAPRTVKHVLIIPWVFLCIALERNTAAHLGEARDADRPGIPAQFQRMTGVAACGSAATLLLTSVMQAM